MRFTKMHGAGNDYVYVDCFAQPIPSEPQQLSKEISNRHTGIGSDGLILICPSESADAKMVMFNADGSRGEMCGNGIRCVAKYLYEHGIAKKEQLAIETDRGVLSTELRTSNGLVETVRVNMGSPILDREAIPTLLEGNPPLDVTLRLSESSAQSSDELVVSCVSMGNPHCVTFVDELNDSSVLGLGPRIERHPAFPNRTNVEFVNVISPRELVVRVWERGSGETLACGTGACAALVAGVLTDRCERQATVRLPGGVLSLEWAEQGVYMTGPATEVFSGDWSSGNGRGA